MIGLRLRALDGTEVDLAIQGSLFAAAEDEVTDWIDLRHLWATSGLADCHAHLGATSIEQMMGEDYDLDEMLAHNVTAQLDGGVLLVADKGSKDDESLRILDWPAEDRPEAYMAGQILAPGEGYYREFTVDVDGPDLPAAVAAGCKGGAVFIKLIGDWPRRGVGAIPNYAEDELRSAVEVAHAHGCRVAIHTAAPETPSMAVAAGVDSIEHGLFLTAADVRALGARRGAWVPTIAAMQGVANMLGPESSGGRLFADGLRNVRTLLGGAPEEGVWVLAGSDMHLPHGGVAAEAEHLVAYGFSPAQAVAALTTNAAAYLGSDRALSPGSVADLVAFDRNPVDDITVLARPAVVFRAGRERHPG